MTDLKQLDDRTLFDYADHHDCKEGPDSSCPICDEVRVRFGMVRNKDLFGQLQDEMDDDSAEPNPHEDRLQMEYERSREEGRV